MYNISVFRFLYEINRGENVNIEKKWKWVRGKENELPPKTQQKKKKSGLLPLVISFINKNYDNLKYIFC